MKKLPVRRPPNNQYEIWNIFKKGKLLLARSRLYQRILQFCKYCATRDDLLHIMVSKPFRSAQKINLFRKSQNRWPQPALRRKMPESQKYHRTPRARARVRKTKIHTKSPRSDLKIKPRILDHPTKWSPKAIFDTGRFRRLMIRTSLLRFTIRSRIKILPTSTGQKKAVSMNSWILFSRLARARRDLADIDDKNRKFKQILSKKCLSKSENPQKSWFSWKFFS